ncbi:MAG TPA: AAA domain-containing protein [Puia sp.]|jgi:hypothetical protein|nr:AAA domain-containing protein [Puia sp.]
MNITGIEFFNEIMEYHSERVGLNSKYSKLRGLLERVCKEITAGEPVQFSNLFSRLNYACKKKGLDRRRTYQLNTFRINANKIQYGQWQPSTSDYLQDLKVISETVGYFYDTAIPPELLRIFPENDVLAPKEKLTGKKFKRIRAFVRDITADTLSCEFEEFANDELYKVKTNVDAEIFQGYYGNREFGSTFKHIWAGASVNLIDVTESEGAFYAEFVVLEPDYLIDISNLAECYKEHGDHQLNYTISRLTLPENKMHFRIGDFANMCLDEQIFNQEAKPIDADIIRSNAFRSFPFEYSTCIDFDEEKYREETERQYLNIRNTVQHTFSENTFRINKDKATVEPSFFCEYFGIQGRLDFFQYQPENDYYNIIELKSGKPPYPQTDPTRIGKNHGTQLFLYYLAVLYNLHEGDRHKENLNVYVLYSKPSTHNLRFEKPALSRLKQIINKRNEIVLIEHFIGKGINGSNAETVFRQIVPAKLILERVNSSFLENYVIPDIKKFSDVFVHSSLLEREYFHSFYTFLTRELFISKIGDGDKDSPGNRGVAGLWQNDLNDKLEAGEILTDLKIKPGGNKADEAAPKIIFSIPDQSENAALPNFRKGEVVNLYERNSESDTVTNKQIFKGAIEQIGQQEVTVRLRFKQRNRNIFSGLSTFAIEPDFLDSSYNWMFKGLFLFLQASADRKDLLLSQRALRFDGTIRLARTYGDKEIDEIVLKAKQAKDYFLLIGPPGTGKTSKALKAMVDEFYSGPENNILLLSYTNRAVDEICDALDSIDNQLSYVRIGNTLSCDEKHKGRLLDCLIADCRTRADVRLKIKSYRIFVGTVSSISGKMELFRLKHFQVAIIDEASQILEPHLLGVLSAKDPEGRNAISKFILIGDNKQLPAVVLQKEQDSATDSPTLNALGLLDRRNSLFERLYNLHKTDRSSPAWGMLYKQGRMHPEVAEFPNTQFYEGRLESAQRDHQLARLEFDSYDAENPLQKLIATKRVVFIPSRKSESDNNKTNSHEAVAVVKLVENIYALYQKNGLSFDPGGSIGIIASYRSQIALIRRELHKLNTDVPDKIMIDTVERFQGSQRDIIIYSFSVNYIHQLNFLARNMEDEGVLIDRKLNVALTRARKQLFITGNPAILSNNPIYRRLIDFISSAGGYCPQF